MTDKQNSPLLHDLKQGSSASSEYAKQRAYARDYWQSYTKRVRRVFGTLSPAEYNTIRQIAEVNDRTVWQQIWLESQAYRSGNTVPSTIVENQQQALLIELRRIGNNINQLAQMGHIQVHQDGHFTARGDDKIGVAILSWCRELERKIDVTKN